MSVREEVREVDFAKFTEVTGLILLTVLCSYSITTLKQRFSKNVVKNGKKYNPNDPHEIRVIQGALRKPF